MLVIRALGMSMLMNKDFLAGFICGEGCFTFLKNYPVFSLTLGVDDMELLFNIKKFVGFGNIGLQKLKGDYKSCCFRVSGVSKCLRLAKILEGNMQGVKSEQFLKWNEGILFLKSKKVFGKKDFVYINSLKPAANKRAVNNKEVERIFSFFSESICCPYNLYDKY